MIELFATLYSIITLILLVARLELGLLLLIPLLLLTGYAYRSPIEGLNATNLLVYTAFVMGLFRRMSRPWLGLPPATFPLVAFFLLIIIEWFVGYLNYRFTPEGYETFRQLKNVQRWTTYTLLYFAYFFGWPEHRPATSAFRWMFAGLLMVILFSFYEVVIGGEYYAGTGRGFGLFRQPNSTGIFLGSFGMLPLVLVPLARTRSARLLYLGSFAASIFALMLTLSRTGFLAMVVGGMVYSYYRSRRSFVAMILVMIALVPTYSIILPEKVALRIDETFTGSEYEGVAGEFEGSTANRLVQSLAGLRLFIDSPVIGHGLGGFWYRSPQYLPKGAPAITRAPHTTFIWLLVDGGIVTLGMFVWLLVAIVLGGKRLFERGPTESERMLGLYMMATVGAKSLANFASTDFLTGDVTAYFWISGAMVAWMIAHPDKVSSVPEPQSEPTRARALSSWRPRRTSALTRGSARE